MAACFPLYHNGFAKFSGIFQDIWRYLVLEYHKFNEIFRNFEYYRHTFCLVLEFSSKIQVLEFSSKIQPSSLQSRVLPFCKFLHFSFNETAHVHQYTYTFASVFLFLLQLPGSMWGFEKIMNVYSGSQDSMSS